jgi:hypothetical protein
MKFDFNEKEVELIVMALGEMPAKMSHHLINKITSEVEKEVEKEKRIEKLADKDETGNS